MATAYSTAGVTLKIGNEVIPDMLTYPDLGSTPPTISTTTLDNKKYESSITGLIPVTNLEFEFIENREGNLQKAVNLEGKQQTYELTLPSGAKATWTGEHRVFISGGGINAVSKFKVSATAATEITIESGSSSPSSQSE